MELRGAALGKLARSLLAASFAAGAVGAAAADIGAAGAGVAGIAAGAQAVTTNINTINNVRLIKLLRAFIFILLIDFSLQRETVFCHEVPAAQRGGIGHWSLVIAHCSLLIYNPFIHKQDAHTTQHVPFLSQYFLPSTHSI
jgi:hypothetical protein